VAMGGYPPMHFLLTNKLYLEKGGYSLVLA
jgi:hypothetical protein